MARLNADGSPDNTFGSAGKVTTDFGTPGAGLTDLAVQSDGKIAAVGNTGEGGDFAVARYNSDGSPDSTFGLEGKVTTDFAGGTDGANSLVLQTDGKIVVAGNSASTVESDNALVRYNVDGSLDPTFGAGGKVTTDLGGHDGSSEVLLQQDGKIVTGGCVRCFAATGDDDFAVARYNIDGSIDSTFGSEGSVTTDFNGGPDRSMDLVVQPDGKLVAAGVTTIGGDQDFALARYQHATANEAIAFASNRDGNFEIYTMNANGGGLQRLTVSPAADTGPVWSPDGTRLAFASNWDGNFEIYTMNANGGGLQRLTVNSAADTTPSWQRS